MTGEQIVTVVLVGVGIVLLLVLVVSVRAAVGRFTRARAVLSTDVSARMLRLRALWNR